ncbi:Mucin 2 precursor [Methylophaga frappieri]|uniref:Mucin 2 n=1 Tax=Methylophaga frappieri (strain ATCC BAA-2434 / DSM 25690 / JAM7) TaxID=754477 RepID=I1YHF0_METFJ|nr:DUF4350 domain-containing protein [Methylophaga frappieri]AFJ02343.1 Mucin 2 precursor [Methylophaga frappieri]
MKRLTTWRHHLQQILFYGLLISAITLAAKITIATNASYDWTQNQRHSLSQSTMTLLGNIDAPITILVFVSPKNQLAEPLQLLLTRYQQYAPSLTVNVIDPVSAPQQVKQWQIQQQGETILQRGDRTERVLDLSEQSLTNALLRLHRDSAPKIVFLTGHGERQPDSKANYGLQGWAQNLVEQGFAIQSHHLTQGLPPDDTDLLVIASPSQPWLSGELALLKTYLNQGGNLLWLNEPDSATHLSELADEIQVQWLPGTLIDPNTSLLGLDDPRFMLISEFANHELTHQLQHILLLPTAAALQLPHTTNTEWQRTPLFFSQQKSWSELGDMRADELKYNEESDIMGPLPVAAALARSIKNMAANQRIVVVGDGDFLSNQYLGNAANQEFGSHLINWLTAQSEHLSIAIKTTSDQQLNLNNLEILLIAIGFLFVLPTFFIISGLLIWWRRRRQ